MLYIFRNDHLIKALEYCDIIIGWKIIQQCKSFGAKKIVFSLKTYIDRHNKLLIELDRLFFRNCMLSEFRDVMQRIYQLNPKIFCDEFLLFIKDHQGDKDMLYHYYEYYTKKEAEDAISKNIN